MEQETAEDPIMFGPILLQRKAVVTYLGDGLSEGGLTAIVETTIKGETPACPGNQEAGRAHLGQRDI